MKNIFEKYFVELLHTKHPEIKEVFHQQIEKSN